MTDEPRAQHDDIEPVFRVAAHQEDGGAVLVVAGDVDMAAVEPLWAAIETLPADRPIVLDFTDVTFLDSVGLTLLVRAHRARDSRRDEVVVRRPRDGVLWALETSGVDQILRLER
jgi:anti-anti-sigma factor